MADRKRHIDTRNLVVCETFDEFAEKVEQINPIPETNVEDIVGYVTSVSRVFYWLNVESVWGVIGFSWNDISTPLEDSYPNIWEHLQHVNADGTNIENPEYPNPNKGWGRFSYTTLPFSIIPKLPDGYRITKFDSTLQGIGSTDIEVQRSQWDNLTELINLAPSDKNVIADFTDAPIISINSLIGTKSSLYIKADLKNVPAFNGATSSGKSTAYNNWIINELSYIVFDDNNKYLNLPPSIPTSDVVNQHYSRFVIKWLGEGSWKDEYMYRNINANSTYGPETLVFSENNKVTLKAFDTSGGYINWQYGNKLAQRDILNYIDGKPRDNGRPIVGKVQPDDRVVELTVDTSITRDINLWQILYLNNWSGPGRHNLAPIQFEGEVDSIDMYLPYLNIVDSWPQFDAALAAKMNPDLESYFCYQVNFVDKLIKCPYTFNVSNLNRVNLNMIPNRYNSDYAPYFSYTEAQVEDVKYPVGNDYVVDVLPNVTGFTSKIFTSVQLPTGVSGVGKAIRIPYSIKAYSINGNGFYLDEGVVFECSSLQEQRWDYGICGIYNTEFHHFKIFPNQEGKINFLTPLRTPTSDYVCSNKGNIDFVEFNFGSFDKANVLKTSTVNTWKVPEANKAFLHPLYLCNCTTKANVQNPSYVTLDGNYGFPSSWTFNPLDIFIYNANLDFTRTSQGGMTMDNVRRIINAIQPIDVQNDYEIRISNWMYSQLTSTEISYIKDTLHYKLTNVIN